MKEGISSVEGEVPAFFAIAWSAYCDCCNMGTVVKCRSSKELLQRK
jgi:hypothetical protein